MLRHWQYLKYVLRHKWFVFVAGIGLGVPIWQLVIHDWHKFLPDEWLPYADYFYGDYPESLKVPMMDVGFYRTKADVAQSFDLAWLKHQKRAPHHWQWWILHEDGGETKVLEMGERFRLEMIADWHGAGKALGKPDTLKWYIENREKMIIHPRTRLLVDMDLGYVDDKVMA